VNAPAFAASWAEFKRFLAQKAPDLHLDGFENRGPSAHSRSCNSLARASWRQHYSGITEWKGGAVSRLTVVFLQQAHLVVGEDFPGDEFARPPVWRFRSPHPERNL
jgi:hypothetical protein